MDQKPDNSSESPLERLRRRVYGGEELRTLYRTRLKESQPHAPEHWQGAPQPPTPPGKRLSAATLFLIGAVAFFAVAVIASAVVLFLGGRSVSSDHIEILVEGPTTVEGTEIASFFITVKNENPVAVTEGALTITLPDGVVSLDTDTRSIVEDLGPIAPGESVRTTLRASFLGEEGQQFTIPLLYEFKTEGSSATGLKKRAYDVILGAAPMSISVEGVEEISAGQPFTLVARIRSNVAGPLHNVAVKADYPTGYKVQTATPAPSAANIFSLGSFTPGEEKRIELTGSLTGVEGDERVFSFTVGTLAGTTTSSFAVPYATHQATLRIAEPFISVGLSLNHDSGSTIVAKAGEELQGLLTWRNALPVPILDAIIALQISGDAIENSGVTVTGGFFRSLDRTILFNPQTTFELTRLEPGETGSGVFALMPLAPEKMAELRNPSMTLTISVAGRRVGEGNVTEIVTSTVTRLVKIQTDLSLAAHTLRSVGPFNNTGPYPPVADAETTYTIRLQAANTVNAVANATARMTLPSYVRFTGKTSGGAITYNETSREVSWSIGDFGAGESDEAYFQVALLPSTSQKGKTPVLASTISITGFDRFVQKEVKSTATDLTTQAPADPSYDINKGQVQ